MIEVNIKNKDPEVLDVNIRFHISQQDVLEFLMKKGYHIKAFSVDVPATEEFLLSEPAFTFNSFTATKSDDEKQGYHTLYDNVFEKEIKSLLKEI